MIEDMGYRLIIPPQQIQGADLDGPAVSMFKYIFQCQTHMPFLRLCSFGGLVLKAHWTPQEDKLTEVLSYFFTNLMLKCKEYWHSFLI